MDKNLEWLTQNNEDLKSNKGNLTPTLRDSIFRRSYPLPPPPFNKGGGAGFQLWRCSETKLYGKL